MTWFVFPDQIDVNVRISMDDALLAFLKQLADQQSDRAAAAALAQTVGASSKALADAIPKP